MSARDDIINEFAHNDRTESELNAHLDAYAHELAEKIRNAEVPATSDDLVGESLCAYIAGSDDAADLIDPEVK